MSDFDPTGTTDAEKLCHSFGFSGGYSSGRIDALKKAVAALADSGEYQAIHVILALIEKETS